MAVSASIRSHTRACPRPPAGQRGALMIEVLIAVLVFSLGVLSIVGLQAQSIRHVNDMQYRGEAIFLVNALVSQMWADDRSTTDPAYLKSTYEDGGAGYAAFHEAVKRLPGVDADKNAPVVQVADGPTSTSRVVTVTVFWQPPGDSVIHNYATNAVIGRNE